MDDSCAVCAGTLDWVAYGACCHRDVCSTCVIRLRFICNDRRCCICKTESNVIFVTKALGVYTSRIKDFSVLPCEVKEGRAGSYWYHEDTQAFFDDVDHYKMIKAMCKLSCNACDKIEDQFNNIEHLRGHLFHRHSLVMCSLCLEGRKAFICEQKLYTREQLDRHINTGDSEVDGSESERGGFMGHPKCEFCETSFYGESELYSHMSRAHYACHICQRQHPGQCKYYKNYDDLEIHFRRDHYQCEDESCLAKKFMVFRSVVELKRHNTSEHGGRMSRAQRNADNRYGKGPMFHRKPSDNDYRLSANVPSTSSAVKVVSTYGNTNDHVQNNTKEAQAWAAWPYTSRRSMKGSSSSSHVSKAIKTANIASVVTSNEVAQSSYVSSSHAQAQTRPTTTYTSMASGSLVSSGNASRISHSSSDPNLANGGYSESKPSVLAAQRRKQSSRSRILRIVEEVQTTNKSLAEKMLD